MAGLGCCDGREAEIPGRLWVAEKMRSKGRESKEQGMTSREARLGTEGRKPRVLPAGGGRPKPKAAKIEAK